MTIASDQLVIHPQKQEEHKKLFEYEILQESGSLQNYSNKSKSTWSKNKKGGIAHYYLENL